VVACCSDKAGADETKMPACNEEKDLPVNLFYVQKPTSRVILSTVRIYAYDSEGNLQICRALLDPGSV